MTDQEQIEILNNLGEKTGEVTDRLSVHKEGKWHRSAHLWLIDDTNHILMQKRSMQKKFYPGQWVAPVSGHISTGESPTDTLIKEAKEELKINIDKEDFFLQAILRGTFDDPAPGLKEREFIHIYITHRKFEVDMKIKNDEVDGFRWFSLDDFKKLVNGKSSTLVPAFQEYEIIISYIKHER